MLRQFRLFSRISAGTHALEVWTGLGWRPHVTTLDTGVFVFPRAAGRAIIPVRGLYLEATPQAPIYVLHTCLEWLKQGKVGDLYTLEVTLQPDADLAQLMWYQPPRTKTGRLQDTFTINPKT